MHEEEIKALARHDKPKAVEQMFNRLLWLKVYEIMQRLDPPAQDTEKVGEMLSRALEAGDKEAQYLMTDTGRECVMKEARSLVDKLLAEDDGGSPQ